MTLHDLQAEMIRLSRQLDKGLDYLREQSEASAIAEDTYRLARARAYLDSQGTVDVRRSITDLATSKERVDAHIADGLRQAALEAVRSRRQQLSALQTLVSAHKAEAEYERTRPE